jgi:hypothetical protein
MHLKGIKMRVVRILNRCIAFHVSRFACRAVSRILFLNIRRYQCMNDDDESCFFRNDVMCLIKNACIIPIAIIFNNPIRYGNLVNPTIEHSEHSFHFYGIMVTPFCSSNDR